MSPGQPGECDISETLVVWSYLDKTALIQEVQAEAGWRGIGVVPGQW
jgi:hypothetical protein